jgi:hypothetical protein
VAGQLRIEVPGSFLRIDPKEVLLATGMHRPELVEEIRRAIDADPKAWETASRAAGFVERGAASGPLMKFLCKAVGLPF